MGRVGQRSGRLCSALRASNTFAFDGCRQRQRRGQGTGSSEVAKKSCSGEEGGRDGQEINARISVAGGGGATIRAGEWQTQTAAEKDVT